ncbi:MAG: DUF4097 family beta strand repeat-containing protein [Eubacteriales bacterium]
MKRPVLIIVINLIVFVLLAGLLAGALLLHRSGVLDGLLFGAFSGGIYASDDSFEVGNATVSADGIRNIDLGWGAGSVTVVVGDADEITLTESAGGTLKESEVMRWKVQDGTLVVRFCKWEVRSFFGFHQPEKSLTLTVPASLAENLGNVKFDTASASVTVDGLVADRVSVDTASGVVKLSNLTAVLIELDSASGGLYGTNLTVGDLDVDTASGKQEFVNCVISGSLDCDSASGSLIFSGSVDEMELDTASGTIVLTLTAPARRIEFDSASGDITMNLPADLPGLEVKFDSASGDLNMNFPVTYNKDVATYGDGSMKVEIDTASGDAEIRMN